MTALGPTATSALTLLSETDLLACPLSGKRRRSKPGIAVPSTATLIETISSPSWSALGIPQSNSTPSSMFGASVFERVTSMVRTRRIPVTTWWNRNPCSNVRWVTPLPPTATGSLVGAPSDPPGPPSFSYAVHHGSRTRCAPAA